MARLEEMRKCAFGFHLTDNNANIRLNVSLRQTRFYLFKLRTRDSTTCCVRRSVLPHSVLPRPYMSA